LIKLAQPCLTSRVLVLNGEHYRLREGEIRRI
jgi:hypothetical protein